MHFAERETENVRSDADAVPLFVAVPDSSPTSRSFRSFPVFSPIRVRGDVNALRFTLNLETTEAPFDAFDSALSPQTLYLCKTFECSDDNGVAMDRLFDGFGDDFSQFLHLTPSSIADSDTEFDSERAWFDELFADDYADDDFVDDDDLDL